MLWSLKAWKCSFIYPNECSFRNDVSPLCPPSLPPYVPKDALYSSAAAAPRRRPISRHKRLVLGISTTPVQDDETAFSLEMQERSQLSTWFWWWHLKNTFILISLSKLKVKSAILAIFQFWQSGTFESVHGIQIFFRPKDFFWSVMKITFTKNNTKLSQSQAESRL